jgi:hypothetical protein
MAVHARRQRDEVEKLHWRLAKIELERAEYDLKERQRRTLTNKTILDRDTKGGYIV